MATRSIVARQVGHTYEGMYVHYDGMPSSMLEKLVAGYSHFGGDVDRVTDYIMSHAAGWSGLGTDWSLPTDYHERSSGESDEFRAYLDSKNTCFCHGERDDKHSMKREGNLDSVLDEQWGYLLDETGVGVYDGTMQVTYLPWDEATMKVLSDEKEPFRYMECGADFERCVHVASYHFDTDSYMGTRQWLDGGITDISDIKTVIIDGERYRVSSWRNDNGRTTITATDENGKRVRRVARSVRKDGNVRFNTNMRYVVPANRDNAEREVSAYVADKLLAD